MLLDNPTGWESRRRTIENRVVRHLVHYSVDVAQRRCLFGLYRREACLWLNFPYGEFRT